VISVIIPHYNQPETLDRCLASLAGQAAGGHAVEVIVADNGSATPPEAVVARHPGVRLIVEAEKGPGPARNAGIRASQGEILAFIDADMEAGPGWLAAIAARLADPSVQVLGGDVRILHRDPAHPTALEAYESEFSFRMEHYIRSQGFTGTGNLAMRRAVFDAVGPFAGMGVAEDRDWGHRATAQGFSITWAPEMLAFHPARTTFAELARKWDRHTAHDFEMRVTGHAGRAKWVLRTVAMALSPLAHAPRVFGSSRIHGGLGAKLRAFAVLARIRLYRAKLMASLAFAGSADKVVSRWRNQG
jgi:glycosyltransferase involved in cell wall biosynthesis